MTGSPLCCTVRAGFAAMAMTGLAVPVGSRCEAQSQFDHQVLLLPPTHDQPRLSPDSTAIGSLRFDGRAVNIVVQPVRSNQQSLITSRDDCAISWWTWCANGAQVLYNTDQNGSGRGALHVVDVEAFYDLELSGTVSAGFIGLEDQLLTPNGASERFLASVPARPDHVLTESIDDETLLATVWLINTRTRVRERVMDNRDGYDTFLADRHGRLRAAAGLTNGYERHVDGLLDSSGAWSRLIRWSDGAEDVSQVCAMSSDASAFYFFDARGREHAALTTLGQSSDGRWTYRELASRIGRDAIDVLVHPTSRRVQAVAFDDEPISWTILDPAIAPQFSRLRGLDRGEPTIDSRDASDRFWIARYEAIDSPARWWLLDTRSGQTSSLFSSRPELERATLAATDLVRIRVRDGIQIEARLTRPFRSTGGTSPLVLLVGPDPSVPLPRRFDVTHQWLADRGYVVLSIDGRGTPGGARRYAHARKGQWGRALQDDLIDAVLWAVDQGIADPDRVAIMGAGYGGYAALMGMTFTPEFFACGISLGGPSNLRSLGDTPESIPIDLSWIAPDDQRGLLAAMSPIGRANRLTRPLLIVHGVDDSVVPIGQSESFSRAAGGSAHQITLLVLRDEGHVVRSPANVIATAEILESFLARSIYNRAETIHITPESAAIDVRQGGDWIEVLGSDVSNDP